MKTITYYLQGKAHKYIPDVRYKMLQHKSTKDFWTFEYTMNKIREFKGKPDWHIATKYISRARKASHWRWSERRGFTVDQLRQRHALGISDDERIYTKKQVRKALKEMLESRLTN